MIVTCKACGAEFRRYPSDLKRGRGDCCSRACSAEYRSRKTERPCKGCGRLFRSSLKQQVFCCRACWTSWIHGANNARKLQQNRDRPEGALTVREVAHASGYSVMNVYRSIWSGELPATKVGRHLFVDPADVQAWLESDRRRGSKKEHAQRKAEAAKGAAA